MAFSVVSVLCAARVGRIAFWLRSSCGKLDRSPLECQRHIIGNRPLLKDEQSVLINRALVVGGVDVLIIPGPSAFDEAFNAG